LSLLANSVNPILIFKHNNVAHGKVNNSSFSPLVQNNSALIEGISLAHFFFLGCCSKPWFKQCVIELGASGVFSSPVD